MNIASLKGFTQRDLAQLAKRKGVPGWRDMRKDQLVRALARLAKTKRDKSKLVRSVAVVKPAVTKATVNKSPVVKAAIARPVNGLKTNGMKTHGSKTNGKAVLSKPAAMKAASIKGSASSKPASSKPLANGHKSNGFKANGHKPPLAKAKPVANGYKSNGHNTNGHKANGHKNGVAAPAVLNRAVAQPPVPKPKSPVVVEKIHKINTDREHLKDLSRPIGKLNGSRDPHKDRIVLLVRDPYWLHVCWEVTRNSVQRAKAAMAEQWHTAKPVLRLLEVGDGATTSSAERVARDIDIHGGVQNWYIDVNDPPQHYRVALGYLSSGGKFYALARSNSVTTPSPGSSDDIDKNWTEVAENYEKIYAQSGGHNDEGTGGDLQSLFEERLRRPMGAPAVARYGVGAERLLNRQREFRFDVDAALVIYGTTKSDAYVTLAGEPVKVRPDGSFIVRLAMPDRRQVLPVVASSGDGIEQRTVVLAVERNTKVMEPMIRDGNE